MTMDSMSELVRKGKDIIDGIGIIQEDETLYSLIIARKSSTSFSCFWKGINTTCLEHITSVVPKSAIKSREHVDDGFAGFFVGNFFLDFENRCMDIVAIEFRESEMFLFCTEKALIERIKFLHFRHECIDDIIWYLFADIALAHNRLVASEFHRRAPVFYNTSVEITECDLILMDEVDTVHRFCRTTTNITIRILRKGSDFFFGEIFNFFLIPVILGLDPSIQSVSALLALRDS